MNSAMLKEAAYALKVYCNNADKPCCGAGAGCLPSAGSTIAAGISIGIILKMYVSLGKMLGVKLGDGVLKSLASAVVADLTGAVAASIAVAAAISFIPASNEPSAAPARAFGECREGQMPHSLLRGI